MEDIVIDPKYNNIIKVFQQALKLNESAIRSAILRSVSMNILENTYLLRNVFRKAEIGSEITIAAIGGSITEGASAKSCGALGNNAGAYTSALGGENCWFNRTIEWFRDSFPQTRVNAINAGIGATPSFLGTFRLEQMVLQHKPDLVFVEFSVNDPSATHNLWDSEIFDAYESIVRRCLSSGISVVQIFLNDRDNNGLQYQHNKIAEYYRVPRISYHNAIYPDDGLICEWSLLSPDEIHPNNVGHALLATCLCNYLDNILQNINDSTKYDVQTLPEMWLHNDTFAHVSAKYAFQFAKHATGNLTYDAETPNCKKWKGALVSSGLGIVRLIVPKGAKRVWVQYFNSIGSFETQMCKQKTVCNTSPTGWPKAMWHRVYTSDALSTDTELTIETHASGQVMLLGLLVSF